MTIFELLLLALGLSMDAFAVCVSNELAFKLSKKKKLFIIILFGFFHFIMPVLGYFTGSFLMKFISEIDHRVALILLLYVGGEMLLEFYKDFKSYKNTSEIMKKNNLSVKKILIQALAVSIDAIVIGISFYAMRIDVFTASFIISFVCMLFCFLGFFIGKKFGLLLKHRSQLFGGLILIGIGFKVFLEHMF